MNAVATKARARQKSRAVDPPSLAQGCQALAVAARAALTSACELDEALQSGDTLRLTRQAAQTLESLELTDGWTPENVAEALFDAIALIRAAATTATDTISIERWALLDRASMLVDTAIGSLPQWHGMEPSGLGKPPDADMLTSERQEVIRMARCEILDWSALIALARDHETFDAEVIQRRMPQLIRRIEELGSIVLSGVADRLEATASLEERLNGWAPQ